MAPPLLFQEAAFWGPVTSSIDWCEPNYQQTRFIAEPLNTVSNLSFVLFGILGAIHEANQRSKRSYVILHSIIACIGLGSMLFHGKFVSFSCPFIHHCSLHNLTFPMMTYRYIDHLGSTSR